MRGHSTEKVRPPRLSRLTCQQCGKPFLSPGNRRKRCPECRVCLICGKLLRGSWMKTCSLSCSAKYKAALHPDNSRHLLVRRTFPKTCDTCGRTFQAKTGIRKRCPECCRCLQCGEQLPNASHRFCGLSCAGKWKFQQSEKVREAIFSGRFAPKPKGYQRGIPHPGARGPNNHNWKGGSTDQRHAAMGQVECKVWRATVFKRDGYACVLCGASKCRLEANHVQRWCDRPDLRYEPDNGVTLCRPCHDSIRGLEAQLAARFAAHVATRAPVDLTAEERSRFVPFITNCAHCGSELKRPRHKQHIRKRHFCNVACVTAYFRRSGHGLH